MSRKQKLDTSPVRVLSADEATLKHMPKYNGFGGGYGAHGKTKYDRVSTKRNFIKEVCDQ